MKILSWNINGIRAAVRKGFVDFLKKEKPDIIALQEIKISDVARAQESFDFVGYQEFYNSAQRPGYSGTAFLVKDGIRVKYLPSLSWDDEGRVQVLDLGKYYLANIYFPNAKDDLSRLAWKIKWNDKLLLYFKKIAASKPLIVTGDYNVAHQEIDLARPKPNIGNAGFTNEERAWMSKFLSQGFKDTFREIHPNKIQYSWWSYRGSARANNVGWRIDYFCVSANILQKVDQAFILDRIVGSDHAPIGIEIK
ncbi:exodeoxyribonuclease III [Candidatus Parcubacteria bacterium]|nr:MAG: exodeoxyribonuclease III [Candidatus Parcubacteria bacterium]